MIFSSFGKEMINFKILCDGGSKSFEFFKAMVTTKLASMRSIIHLEIYFVLSGDQRRCSELKLISRASFQSFKIN